MPEILEYSTCNVCLETVERTWYFESPDGLKFEICLACLKSAQQKFAPDVSMCEDCGKNPVLEGCSVCAECGL